LNSTFRTNGTTPEELYRNSPGNSAETYSTIPWDASSQEPNPQDKWNNPGGVVQELPRVHCRNLFHDPLGCIITGTQPPRTNGTMTERLNRNSPGNNAETHSTIPWGASSQEPNPQDTRNNPGEVEQE